MIPGLGGLNPKKMQAMMKQMGIDQSEISTEKVTIEKSDGSKIIIQPANVQKINMQGQTSYQITGDEQEESQAPSVSKEDIKTIVEKTGKSETEAKETLEKTNDLAEAILELSS